MNCPVCKLQLPQKMPSFCPRCAWDLKNDLTLNTFLSQIPEEDFTIYRKKLHLAKQNWEYSQNKNEIHIRSTPERRQTHQGKQITGIQRAKRFFNQLLEPLQSHPKEQKPGIPVNKQNIFRGGTHDNSSPPKPGKAGATRQIKKEQQKEPDKTSQQPKSRQRVGKAKNKTSKQPKIPQESKSIQQPVFKQKVSILTKSPQRSTESQQAPMKIVADKLTQHSAPQRKVDEVKNVEKNIGSESVANRELIQLEIENNRLALELKKAEIEAANLQLEIEREKTNRDIELENRRINGQVHIEEEIARIREHERHDQMMWYKPKQY